MIERITVRRASPRDRGQLVAFHHALYVDHKERIIEPDLEPFYAYRDLPTALREDVDSILRSPGSIALLAERQGTALGYITGHVEDEPRRLLRRKGVVEDWFVDTPARGQGVGKLLMSELMNQFRERGCQVVESATWSRNTGARAAHDALGFHEVRVTYRARLR